MCDCKNCGFECKCPCHGPDWNQLQEKLDCLMAKFFDTFDIEPSAELASKPSPGRFVN